MIGLRSLGVALVIVVCFALGGGACAADPQDRLLSQALEQLVAQPVTAADDPDTASQLAAIRRTMDELQAVIARGGWGQVSPGPKLEPGAHDLRIIELRRRLGGASPAEDSFYDPALVTLVKGFQTQHGLNPDGMIGPATLAALNRSPEYRLGQWLVAFDKIRQQAAMGDAPRIRVNLPAFTLEIYEGGVMTGSMPVVIGRPDRQTPLFSSRINQVILNPSWTVPAKLASEDLLPKLRRNPNQMIRQGFSAYQGYEPAQPVDLALIDWSMISKRRLPFWFRQEPGPGNSLGRYKISMPNDQDIYLHDTPERSFFARDNRALSSGCIRVARPGELASWLLRHNHGWSADLIAATIQSGVTTHIPLSRGVPIFLDYQSAWIDHSGAIQYRDDIYGIDKLALNRLLLALGGSPPAIIALSKER